MKLVPFVQVHTYKDVELFKVAKDGMRQNITSLKSFHIVYLSTTFLLIGEIGHKQAIDLMHNDEDGWILGSSHTSQATKKARYIRIVR